MDSSATIDLSRVTDARETLAAILDGIAEGFYAVDRAWTITLFNSEATYHFGHPAEQVLGRNLWDVFPGARETQLGRVFLDAMASRARVMSETESVVVPGRWLSFRLFPLGEGLGIAFHDITEWKAADPRLQRR